jgi:hypothetical protein
MTGITGECRQFLPPLGACGVGQRSDSQPAEWPRARVHSCRSVAMAKINGARLNPNRTSVSMGRCRPLEMRAVDRPRTSPDAHTSDTASVAVKMAATWRIGSRQKWNSTSRDMPRAVNAAWTKAPACSDQRWPETKCDEHERLLKRTAELRDEHAALSLDQKPFNQSEHDRHSEALATHKKDLITHRSTR